MIAAAQTLNAPIVHALRGKEFIEYDNPPGDVFEEVAASLAFLRDGGFAR